MSQAILKFHKNQENGNHGITNDSLRDNMVHPVNEYVIIYEVTPQLNGELMVMKSFLRFRVSRPGHFKQLLTGDASPSAVLPASPKREARGSPIQ